MSQTGVTSSVTNRTDAASLHSRVFIGNLNTAVVTKADVEAIFSRYGPVLGCSVHKGYAFVQYARQGHAQGAVLAQQGRRLAGQALDINMAGEQKPQRAAGVKRPGSAPYRPQDHRRRASLLPRLVPLQRPRVAEPVMRRVKSLPVKLKSRSPTTTGRSVRQELKPSELWAIRVIRADLAQIKSSIDALLDHLERLTPTDTEHHRAGEGSGEVSANQSATDTESRHPDEEEEEEEAPQDEHEEFMV